jgi:hypothetical protein
MWFSTYSASILTDCAALQGQLTNQCYICSNAIHRGILCQPFTDIS